ncbi:helix-turn-helix domain-containing protein [Zhongshania aquimaris]|uniref:AraC family transcriptional regulator n=1 Tax=Zhongshania aquimaris TaxID=2857107 RepID=A0ABS6VUZ3_9GAMM|nr:AraC family transcriptional regulator [Zhongshania aquimaris]MBW2942156.1 AraC family transcriptional regulator [Zhongshania aquimaris]
MSLIRSGAIAGFSALVSRYEVNPVDLLTRVGLSSAQLRDPNNYIAYSQVARLLELAAESCGQMLFGLLLAQRQTSTVLGDIALGWSQQPTMQAAIDKASQQLYLHVRGLELQQRIEGDMLRFEFAFMVGSHRGIQQLIQLSYGHLCNFIDELVGAESRELQLSLHQSAGEQDLVSLLPRYASRLLFGAADNFIKVPLRWGARKPHVDTALLAEHFRLYVSNLEQSYPDSVSDRIKSVLGRLLRSGDCSVTRVAAVLDLQPRVLQKRLAAQGMTYSSLLRETRQQIAEQYLANNAMSVTELALNLGYAEVAVFSRHFKQWTGLSPRQWQRQRQKNTSYNR